MIYFVMLLWTVLASSVGVRPRRDFAGLEERRRKAARLFAKGRTQAEVARELEVSRQSVSRWYADWQAGGTSALRGARRAGRLPRLSDAQLKQVVAELKKGPRAHGYATGLWTLSRVGEVIEALTGVSYHPGHVYKLLTERMGWSRQRPARQAFERNDEAIARWVAEDWPRVKKTQKTERPGSASKTRAGSA
jgi:transposase